MPIEALKQIWPEWQIEGKPLGKGSYGVVYKAVRRDHGVESCAAIKVISIPSDPSEVDSLRSEGLDVNATRTYLEGIVNDFVSEIQLMETLKGVQNIVSVEDYKVVEKREEIGWEIYIRMELLTPFNTYLCDQKLTEEDVIKLGCDICSALEICAKRNIIHRDIKPENIFINDFGHFKLGDFGIARKLENMTGGLSQKGTFNYMAPEVAVSNEYDGRVDTYSLGIVLYRLLNGNRLPFLDTEQQLLNPNERRNAVDRRLRGEKLAAPCDASPAMAALILRACAYDPNMRFSSATEMKAALMRVAEGTYPLAAGNVNGTISVRKPEESYDRTTSVRRVPAANRAGAEGADSPRVSSTVSVARMGGASYQEKTQKHSKRKAKGAILGIAAGILAAVILFFFINTRSVIDLNDFVQLESKGYDGNGTVTASIDWKAIQEKYGDHIEFTKEAKKKDSMGELSPVEFLEEKIRVELDPASGLSNGDKIQYSFAVEDDLKDQVDCRLKYKEKTYEVQGLETVETFDAYQDLEVSFTGTEPYGEVIFAYSGDKLSSNDFSADRSGELSNHETITVKLREDVIESCLERYGKVPARLEAEYTVSGLDKYVTQSSEIDAAVLDTMKQSAEAAYQNTAQSWGEGEELLSLTYLGNYLLLPKQTDPARAKNAVFLVYKAQIKNRFTNGSAYYSKVNDCFWYMRFTDLAVHEGHTVFADTQSGDMPQRTFYVDTGIMTASGTKHWNYSGYPTLEALYEDIVMDGSMLLYEDSVDASLAPADVSLTESYAQTIVNTIETSAASNPGITFLYDMDQDGVEELCMITSQKDVGRTVCSIYSLEKSEPILLMQNIPLYLNEKDVQATVAFANAEGTPQVMIDSNAGEQARVFGMENGRLKEQENAAVQSYAAAITVFRDDWTGYALSGIPKEKTGTLWEMLGKVWGIPENTLPYCIEKKSLTLLLDKSMEYREIANKSWNLRYEVPGACEYAGFAYLENEGDPQQNRIYTVYRMNATVHGMRRQFVYWAYFDNVKIGSDGLLHFDSNQSGSARDNRYVAVSGLGTTAEQCIYFGADSYENFFLRIVGQNNGFRVVRNAVEELPISYPCEKMIWYEG